MNFASLDEETKRRIISTYNEDFSFTAEPEEPLILCGYEFELLQETNLSRFIRLYQITTEYGGSNIKDWQWCRWKLNVVYEINKKTNDIAFSTKFSLQSSAIHPDCSIELSDLFEPEACLKAANDWHNDFKSEQHG